MDAVRVESKDTRLTKGSSVQHNYNLRSTTQASASNDAPILVSDRGAEVGLERGPKAEPEAESGTDRGTEEYIKVLKQALLEVASENELVKIVTLLEQLRKRVTELEAELQQADRDLEAKEKAIVELEGLLKVTHLTGSNRN